MLSHVEVYKQREVWSRLLDDLFVALDVNKAEWLRYIHPY